jgi:hypothetical protein
MSQESLVNEYVAGRISRRTLIRRLVATGVSFGAAVSYAHLLNPDRAPAKAFGDEYGFVTVRGKILEQDLDKVIAEERVKVRLWTSHRGRVELKIELYRAGHEPHERDVIGERIKRFDRPLRKKDMFVPLAVNPPHSVDALRPLPTADLTLHTVVRRLRFPEYGHSSHQRILER